MSSPRHFLGVLRLVPRLHAESGWTARDRAAVLAHFVRLQEFAQTGRVVLAGRTEEPYAVTFGVVLFTAADDAAAHGFLREDPAVAGGVMTYTLHPYRVAVMAAPLGTGAESAPSGSSQLPAERSADASTSGRGALAPGSR